MWPSDVAAEWREEISALDWFDSSAWLGRTPAFPLMREGTPELLAEILEKTQARGALVSHWMGSETCSPDSNRILLSAVEQRDSWYATLALQPFYPGDPGSPASPGWVWPAKAKAVRIYPAAFKFALTDWCAGSLCEMLIERRLPLILLHTEVALQDLYGFATRYPRLPIVLESQVRKILYHVRMVLPLLQACPNIHLEISNFCSQGMIEYTVRSLGPDRLVLGAFAPANDPLVPLGLLVGADLSREEKQAIAGGNIRRLISEVRP